MSKGLNNSLTPIEQRKQFFLALYGYCTHQIELRALPFEDRTFVEDSADERIETFISNNKALNLYFGVATRDGNGGKKKNTKEVPALWLDVDFKDFKDGEEEARKVLQNIIPPSAVIHSGNGWHLYWIFEEPEEASVERIEPYLKGMAKRFKGDLNSAELARVLRIPGTFNYKNDQKKPVKLIKLNGNRYNLSDFDDYKDESPITITKVASPGLEQLTSKCDFIKYCDENRTTLPEPLWYAMVSNVSRISPGGLDLVHALSQDYPKYSRNETDQDTPCIE